VIRSAARSSLLPLAALAFCVTLAAAAQSQPAAWHPPAATEPQPATRLADARQYEQWRRQIKQALFIPDRLPDVAPHDYGSFSPVAGVIAERVTYATTYGMRVPAIVYRPAKMSGHAPGMVVVNGHSGDKTAWYAYYTGILYAAPEQSLSPTIPSARMSETAVASPKPAPTIPSSQVPRCPNAWAAR
jgi:hypothetical protein